MEALIKYMGEIPSSRNEETFRNSLEKNTPPILSPMSVTQPPEGHVFGADLTNKTPPPAKLDASLPTPITTVSAQAAPCDAIRLAIYYLNLSDVLFVQESTSCQSEEMEGVLEDNSTMTVQSLLLKAIHLSPNLAVAYLRLGDDIPLYETIPLLNDWDMSAEQLFLMAIYLDPTLVEAYRNLNYIISLDALIILCDGSILTAQEFFAKTIALDPSFELAKKNLARTIPLYETYTLLDGSVMFSLSGGHYVIVDKVNYDILMKFEAGQDNE